MNENVNRPFEVDQHITAMSRYYAGRIGSRFYIELRDRQKIMGIKCPKCGRVYAPPRQMCGPCFYPMNEGDMVEIGPMGTVVSYTRVEYDSAVMPRKYPSIYTLIQLDGADTALPHFLECGAETVEPGMRVEPVFAEERKGNILDIR
ncbi:MAG: Zn-ribbon domain-containing OB-fold protein, partial [Spirochaetales bacterium]